MIIKKISDLPLEVINLIKDFIPNSKRVFLNKTFYNLYHFTINNRRTIPLYDNYIRDIIRRDNDFVFEKVVNENIDSWLHNKQYIYKNMIFKNYLYFIMNFCVENNSERCRKLLLELLEKRDLCRNLYKKNVVRYIKWKN
jgi:hypothetical protein